MVPLGSGGAMAAYSMDLRERVAHACDRGMPVAAVATQFEVSVAWVYRLLQRRRATGSISPRKQTKFRGRSLSNHEEMRRSEEHTSELQSLAYLVCRLLLE